jgi:hypothetical protein
MSITHRFGKRIPLPATRQIRHELILMWAEDELKKSEARRERAIPSRSPSRISEGGRFPPGSL